MPVQTSDNIIMMGKNGSDAGTARIRPSTRLRQLLGRPGSLLSAPGVFDGISARVALAQGPEALYMTGAGVTASRLGLPDLGFASQDDFVEQASMIQGLAGDIPLIADADVGFGSANKIARTVERFDRAGVAGLHIEDQVQTKRCGHLLGKQLVPSDEFAQRIRAAVLGRARCSGSDIVIIARTDAIQSLGLDEAILRLKLAVAEGADVAFLEGVTSREQVDAVVGQLAPTPVLVNLVPGGVTPDWTKSELLDMGVKLAIYPGVGLMAAADALRKAYSGLLTLGRDDSPVAASPREFFGMLGLKECLELDAAAGGKLYVSGV